MRLLIDMNLTPLWVPFFAEQGFESIHWSSIGTFRARHAHHGLRERKRHDCLHSRLGFRRVASDSALQPSERDSGPDTGCTPGSNWQYRLACHERQPFATRERRLGNGGPQPAPDSPSTNLVGTETATAYCALPCRNEHLEYALMFHGAVVSATGSVVTGQAAHTRPRSPRWRSYMSAPQPVSARWIAS